MTLIKKALIFLLVLGFLGILIKNKKNMANHASAKKRIRRTLTRTIINNERRSKVKTAVKKVYKAIETKNAESSLAALRKAESVIMSGVSKGIIKKKTASRKVSRLSKLLKKSCA